MKALIILVAASMATWVTASTARTDELNAPIEILTDDGKKVGELPAERHYIPFDGLRGDARMGVTSAGHIYVALGDKLCSSTDEGRSWTSRELPLGSDKSTSAGFGVIADDVFVLSSGYPKQSTLRSTDLGKTWSDPTPIDISPFASAGGGWSQISQMAGGPALMTVQCRYGANDPKTSQPRTGEKPGLYDHVYRSTDGGKTWGDRSQICRDSAESSVLLLKSGKMLAAIRRQRGPARLLPGDDIEALKAMDGWRNGKPYIKHGFLADSYDKGNTWKNVRLAPNTPDMKHGLCPSDLVQLPDGRVVWIYTHRYGKYGGVMARVSEDDGATWSAERYWVRRLRDLGHGTYPTNTVLADGTVLTVCSANHGNRAIAIRWRLSDKDVRLEGND